MAAVVRETAGVMVLTADVTPVDVMAGATDLLTISTRVTPEFFVYLEKTLLNYPNLISLPHDNNKSLDQLQWQC
jgi:hypothetical protein